jgi:hypothetical protein
MDENLQAVKATMELLQSLDRELTNFGHRILVDAT